MAFAARVRTSSVSIGRSSMYRRGVGFPWPSICWISSSWIPASFREVMPDARRRDGCGQTTGVLPGSTGQG